MENDRLASFIVKTADNCDKSYLLHPTFLGIWKSLLTYSQSFSIFLFGRKFDVY